MISIEKILCSEQHGVISFVGAGGKTSLMFHLARQLDLSGFRVLTTTTTKISVPTPEQSETVLVDADPRIILLQASACRKTSNHVTAAAAYLSESGKLKGFDPEAIKLFEESGLFDWILVEADGSAGRPLKAPADHEPVIPSNSSVLLAMAGLDAIGKPLSENSVFRSALAGKLMLLTDGETVTESAMARLFANPAGSFKGAPSGSRRFIFLNKADDSKHAAAGARIAELLRKEHTVGVESLIVGQTMEQFTIHSVHSLTEKKWTGR